MFDIKVGNKNHFKNNLSKLLQSRLEIKYAGEVIYENSHESVFETYMDKWLSKSIQDDLLEHGLGSQNWRKLTSKDDE